MGDRGEWFPQVMHEAHAALIRELAAVEECVAAGSTSSGTETQRRLVDLRSKLVNHFAFEEKDGYMVSVLGRAPHLDHVVKELLEQHRQLADALDALIGEAKQVAEGSLDDGFRSRVQEWIVRIRRHEKRENGLIQEAYNRDIGTQD